MLFFNERTGEFEERPKPGEQPSSNPSGSSSNSFKKINFEVDRQSVRDKVYDILSDVLFLEWDEIEDDSFIEDDLCADHSDMVDIVEQVENDFDILLLDEEVDTVVTVEDLIDLICDNIVMRKENDYYDSHYSDSESDFDDWKEVDDDDWEEDDDEEEDDDWDEDDDEEEDDDWDEDDDSDTESFDIGRDRIQDEVFSIIEDKLSVDYDDISEDSYLCADLGADSLDYVELVMEFEKVYGISIDDEEIESIETVGDIIDYIYYNT